jgi:WhiB family redox-sensing transcriptional regulator
MADTQRLPKPFTSEWDWQLQGSCQGLNSSVFFHPDGERGAARARRADRAKAICQRCPVLEQCRRHALVTREPYGVWGGLTEEERRELWTNRVGQLPLEWLITQRSAEKRPPEKCPPQKCQSPS